MPQDLAGGRLLFQRLGKFGCAIQLVEQPVFSIAITAWSAKVWSKLIWWSGMAGSCSDVIPPASPPRSIGTAEGPDNLADARFLERAVSGR
jgi:hypothetical protein